MNNHIKIFNQWWLLKLFYSLLSYNRILNQNLQPKKNLYKTKLSFLFLNNINLLNLWNLFWKFIKKIIYRFNNFILCYYLLTNENAYCDHNSTSLSKLRSNNKIHQHNPMFLVMPKNLNNLSKSITSNIIKPFPRTIPFNLYTKKNTNSTKIEKNKNNDQFNFITSVHSQKKSFNYKNFNIFKMTIFLIK